MGPASFKACCQQVKGRQHVGLFASKSSSVSRTSSVKAVSGCLDGDPIDVDGDHVTLEMFIK